MQGRPFRVRPAYVLLDLGPIYPEFKQYIHNNVDDAKQQIDETIEELIEYISSKLDSPGNLVESCNDISSRDYRLGELTYGLGSYLFNQFLSLGLYDTDGLSFYRFSKFIDSSTIMLSYDDRSASMMTEYLPGQLAVVDQKEVMSMSLDTNVLDNTVLGVF